MPAILAVAFCLFVVPIVALFSVPVDADGPMLVVAGPGDDLEQIVEKSGGWVVGVSRAPLAIMGFSDRSDFEIRLKENGAWAILDGNALAWLCGVKV